MVEKTLRHIPRIPLELALAVVAGVVLWMACGLWSNALDLVVPKLTTPSNLGPVLDDYGVFHVAARMVGEGEGSHLYDLEVVHQEQAVVYGPPVEKNPLLPFFNPPAFAAILVPLSFLPINVAAGIFLAASVAALVAAGSLLWRHSQVRGVGTWLWVAVILSFLPLQDAIYHGQLSFFLLLIWTASFFLFAQGRDRLAGATLALLLIKPHMMLLPLAILVWKRRWQALQGVALAAAGGVVLSVLASGPGILWAYPNFLRDAASWDDSNGITIRAMFGWNAFFRVLLGPGQHASVSLWALAMSVPTVLACLLAWRGPWEASPSGLGRKFAVLAMAVLLINPHLYRQDLILLLFPAALMLGAATSPSSRLLLSGCLLAGWTSVLYHFVLLEALGFNLTVVSMALFLALCVVATLRRPMRLPVRRRSLPARAAAEVPAP